MGKRGPTPKFTVCTLDYCDKKYYAKGFCHEHYERNRLGTTLERPFGMQERVYQKIDTYCEGPGCKRKVYSKGVCRAHYMQKWNGYELTPVNVYKWQEITATGRICTLCDQLKDDDCFYIRSNGNTHTRCKKCLTAKAAVNQARRKNQIPPEWAVNYLANL